MIWLNSSKKYFHHIHGVNHNHPHDDDALNPANNRQINIGKKVLDANQVNANINRQLFTEKGIFVLNIMSSPGSGKTTTLEKTLNILKDDIRCAVVVGDICTTNDADRLSVSGMPAIQINTDAFGGDCHLTAHEVKHALDNLNLDDLDLLIIENVGNLVCPAEFDMGEDARVVILSVTEGEDKPLKYPLMFRESHIALLNKIDLLPYLDFDLTLAKENISRIHPDMKIIDISAKTLEGFDLWIAWIKEKVLAKK
jgi:hydrogenase nickel incorporation protein HypB